jgi:hypothetical protein
MTPEQEKKLSDIHMAVIGNKDLRQPGLLRRVEELEAWRDKTLIKVAFISGVVSAVVSLAQYILK